MAVADLLDGFVVEPDPQREQGMRMIAIAVVVSGFAIVLALAVVAGVNRQPILFIIGLAYLLLIGPTSWAFWRAVKPPVLNADSMSVTYAAAFKTTQVPRAELSMIFKGQTFAGGRARTWLRGYLFTVAGGTIAFTVPKVWFRSDDMAEFARRLGLPMRGDFSQRVHDVVSEGS